MSFPLSLAVPRHRQPLLATAGLLCLLAAGSLLAQGPVVPPAPTPTPAPVGLDPYQAARVPTVSVTTSALPAATTNATGKLNRRLSRLAARGSNPADAPPVDAPVEVPLHGRVFEDVSLGYLDGGNAPAPAAVSLQFDPTRAGTLVWVQPMDGGAILTTDAEGQPVSSKAGSAVPINAQGQVVFSYQAPARPGRYRVYLRLDSVATVLPFVILDPRDDN